MAERLKQLLLCWLALSNAAAFLLMGADKGKARRGGWRISEKALFLFPLLGGALGGLAGMHLFHHKTRHWYFRYGFLLLLALQLAGVGWLLLHT